MKKTNSKGMYYTKNKKSYSSKSAPVKTGVSNTAKKNVSQVFPGKNGFTKPQIELYQFRVKQACDKMFNDLLRKGWNARAANDKVYGYYKEDILAAQEGGVSMFTMLPDYQECSQREINRTLNKYKR